MEVNAVHGSYRTVEYQAPEHIRGISSKKLWKISRFILGFETFSRDVSYNGCRTFKDSPDEIPVLYRMITKINTFGFRLEKKRSDPLSKTIHQMFNANGRKISGIKNLHDFNCGLKAYRREVIKNSEVYGRCIVYSLYREKSGFTKIGEKIVHNQARKYGKTKFG
jgi:hypothetical protein